MISKRISLALIAGFLLFCFVGCANPLVEGNVTSTEPVSKMIPADPNKIYYATKWAFEQCGYPMGPEKLIEGILESKYIPVSPATHYMELFKRREYGATGSYYRMVVKIIPVDQGQSKVEARTDVNSIVLNMKSTGEAERKVLEKIAEYSRGFDITVTNIGIEE